MHIITNKISSIAIDSYVIHTLQKYFSAAIIASSFSGGCFGCVASSDFTILYFPSQ